MLKAENINLSIQGTRILSQVSCSFGAGTLNLVLGPNGAGKSSLLRILAGQQRPDSGTVYYDEQNAASLSLSRLARQRAVLSQSIEIAFPLQVDEVVLLGRSPHFQIRPTAGDLEACREAMAFFNVDGLASRQYLSLSGGEKQRVHFARVLAQIWQSKERSYLFLDEPLTFLDIRYQLEFMDKVKQLLTRKDLIVIGVVHDLNLAARYADNLLLLKEGNVHAQGDVKDVLTASNITAVYGVASRVHEGEEGVYILF